MSFLFVMLLTFLVMEGITWLTHKYVNAWIFMGIT